MPAAFALPLSSPPRPPAAAPSATRPCLPRPSTARRRPARACAAGPAGPAPDEDPPLFVDGGSRELVDGVSLRQPLSADERAAVLRALPRPVARFLIRRADEGAAEEAGGAGGAGRAAQLRRLRARRWLRAGDGGGGDGEEEVDEDDWYREYVQDGMDGGDVMDEFGRAVEGEVFAPTPRVEGVDRPLEGEVAVLAGAPGDPPDQAQTIAYGVLSFVVAAVAFKVLFAFLQFFVSFTFSFFAIFALSAGIFVFFFLLKF